VNCSSRQATPSAHFFVVVTGSTNPSVATAVRWPRARLAHHHRCERCLLVDDAERRPDADLDCFLGHCCSVLQNHVVGRLVTTQVAEGLGTLKDMRSSAR
jgi:hypothetical protein